MDEEARKYIIEKFGRMHPVFEHMDRYSPEIVEGFIKIRKATLPPAGVEGAIPEKYKELIITAVEVATGRGEKGRSHAESGEAWCHTEGSAGSRFIVHLASWLGDLG